MPDLSIAAWTAVIAVMAVGALVQGSVGFGMNVLAAPLLVQIEPAVVPGPLIMAGIALSLLVAVREHVSIVPRQLSWAVAGVLPGTAAGVLLVTVVSEDQIAIFVAVAVLLVVAATATRVRLPVTPGTLLGAGLTAGATGTATSIVGPPMALLLQRGDGPVVRANLGAFFVVASAIGLAGLSFSGDFSVSDVRLGLGLLPGVVIGFLVSSRFREHADKGAVRPAVLVLSATAAGLLLLRTLVW